MEPRQRVMTVLSGGKADVTPVFSANQTATVDQMEATGCYWPEAFREAHAMAELAAAAHALVGFDAVRVPFCQTIEAEALGATVRYGGQDAFPQISQTLTDTTDAKLPDSFLSLGRIPQVTEAVRLLKRRFGAEVAVMGGITGPFSVAGELLSLDKALRLCVKSPESLAPVLDIAERAGTTLGLALIAAGADAIVIEDMLASPNVLSPAMYRRLALPYERRQIEALSAVPTILHICGNTTRIAMDMAGAGASALSLEPSVDLASIKHELAGLPRKVVLLGGVDSLVDLFSGSPDSVAFAAREAAANGYDIVAPGCAVPPSTTISNLRAMVDALRTR